MKQILRKIIILGIATFLILMTLAPIFAVNDDEFANNPGKYQQLCQGVISQSDRETCRAFKKYLLEQADKDQSTLDKLEADKEAIKKDIIANLGKIAEYDETLKTIQAKISEIEAQIQVKVTEIAKIEVDIENKLAKIAETEEEVKAFMVSSQSTMRVNGYIEFVMGAKDFSDIIRRVEGMNAIQKYNKNLIQRLKVERESLETSKIELETQKENIELDKQLIEVEKREIERVRSIQVVFYEELKNQQIKLDMQAAAVQEQISMTQDLADKISDIVYSGGFMFPVPGSYKTQTIWHYDANYGGGFHLGVDLAAGTNTPIYAMGSGIVMVAAGGCKTTGSFGCNGGLGNHLMMIFMANNHVYATLIMHIAAGSFTVSPMQTVDAGQMIARVGNSGNSLGSHAHIEIFDLGVSTIPEGVALWNQPQYRTAQFGLGGSASGYNSLCSNRGTPCRVNPEPLLGLSH